MSRSMLVRWLVRRLCGSGLDDLVREEDGIRRFRSSDHGLTWSRIGIARLKTSSRTLGAWQWKRAWTSGDGDHEFPRDENGIAEAPPP